MHAVETVVENVRDTGHVELFERHRGFLFGLAYRMLGSAMDAEDLLQESFLQFQKMDLALLREPAAMLSTVVTRRCLDYLKSARVRRETYVGPWLPEPLVGQEEAGPAGALERSESVSTAFLLMLELLSPVERAVYLLRDVFDYDYAEIAVIVDRSAETCRRTASRARQRLRRRQAEEGARLAEQPRFEITLENKERLLERFLRACRAGDLDGLVEVLADDARMYSDGGGRVVAALNPIFGATNTGRFVLGVLQKSPPRFPRRIRVAGEPALALFDLNGGLDSVITFAYGAQGMQDIYSVRNPDKLKGLARTLRPGWWRLRYYRLLYWIAKRGSRR